MNTDMKIARIVGALFIITMIAGMTDAYFVAPILKTALSDIYLCNFRVITGAFLILAMSAGIVGIAVALYPILNRHSEIIAITYVSFRVIECMLLLIGVIVYFYLLTLSQEYISAGTPHASYFLTLSVLAIKLRYISYQIAMVILGIGSMFLCYLLFQTKIVPRFLSVWGFFGYTFLFASGLLDVMGVVDTVNGAGAILYIPGGLWEFIAFPIWLFLKGFNSPVIENEKV
jgi:Domain of unknown function (DUF4386)